MCFKEFVILEGRACYFLYSMYCTVLLIVAKVTFLLLLGELIMVLLLLVPWCFCCWCLLGQCCYMVLWCYGANHITGCTNHGAAGAASCWCWQWRHL